MAIRLGRAVLPSGMGIIRLGMAKSVARDRAMIRGFLSYTVLKAMKKLFK